MSDLDVLFPFAEVNLRGEVFRLRPLPLRMIPAFFRVAKAWDEAVSSGGHSLDMQRECEAYDLLGWTIGRTGAWCKMLPESAQLDLLAAAMAVNHDLFDHEDDETENPNLPKMTGPNVVRAKARRPDLDWGEAMARLISGGHSWSEIQEYTLPMIKVFLHGLMKVERDRHSQDVIASTFAMADGKATKKYLQDLTRD